MGFLQKGHFHLVDYETLQQLDRIQTTFFVLLFVDSKENAAVHI